MKITLKAVTEPFKSLSKGFKKVGHFLGKITNKSKIGIVYILKRERVETLRSLYQDLLSKQNKNLLHLSLIHI